MRRYASNVISNIEEESDVMPSPHVLNEGSNVPPMTPAKVGVCCFNIY